MENSIEFFFDLDNRLYFEMMIIEAKLSIFANDFNDNCLILSETKNLLNY